jgi:hypothetical protein
MEQKDLIVVFKQQLSAQGIHLTTVNLSTKQENASGRHFTPRYLQTFVLMIFLV